MQNETDLTCRFLRGNNKPSLLKNDLTQRSAITQRRKNKFYRLDPGKKNDFIKLKLDLNIRGLLWQMIPSEKVKATCFFVSKSHKSSFIP
jgi:hypothetical protein